MNQPCRMESAKVSYVNLMKEKMKSFNHSCRDPKSIVFGTLSCSESCRYLLKINLTILLLSRFV